MTKTSFTNDKLAKNIHGLATTGLNINKEVFIDQSKFGSSSKYGKSALQRPHPNWNVTINFIQELRLAYNNPRCFPKSESPS